MKTVRVVVTRSHRHSMDRIVEVGEVLDLPEHVATERMTTGAVKAAPAAGVAGPQVSGSPAGAAPAAPAPEAAPKVDTVAASEQPAAPAEPPAAEPEPDNSTPEQAAPAPTSRGRKHSK